MNRIVFLNGKYIKENEAKISIFDRGLLFADSVYEVTAVLDNKLIDFPAHIKRLDNSLKELEIKHNIKVRRLSGCSIGSIIALSYLIDLNYDINDVFISTCKNFKKTFNLSVFKTHIKKISSSH